MVCGGVFGWVLGAGVGGVVSTLVLSVVVVVVLSGGVVFVEVWVG